MQELISKIMQKAIEISQNTNFKVMVDYIGSCNTVKVLYRHSSEEKYSYRETVYLNWNNAKEKLEEILQELKSLEIVGFVIFLDENDKGLSQDELIDIFRYEDFLKETILKKNIGQKMLNELQNNTYRQIFIHKKRSYRRSKK